MFDSLEKINKYVFLPNEMMLATLLWPTKGLINQLLKLKIVRSEEFLQFCLGSWLQSGLRMTFSLSQAFLPAASPHATLSQLFEAIVPFLFIEKEIVFCYKFRNAQETFEFSHLCPRLFD